MNYSVFRFTLNMHNHRSQVAIPVFLGDTGIRLLISITDGGTPYFIEDGCTAYIRGKKADGKGLFNQCLILNNTTIQYDFTKQTSNCEGITTCEIELYGKDGTLITAPKFIIVVDSRSLSDSEIAAIIEESDAEVSIIPKVIATIESEDARVEAETSRVNAEADRVMSEEEREVNEAGRVKTEQERVTAEESRAEAERLRAEAEAERITFDEAVSLSESMFASANLATDAANRVESIKSSITRNSKRITNLERGIVPSPFETDSDVAYIKDVPENALPYAGISKIGGMTYKDGETLKNAKVTAVKSVGTNILNLNGQASPKPQNGLTLTLNGDGTFTVNGTSTAPTSFFFASARRFPTGNYYLKLNGTGMGWNSYYGGYTNDQTQAIDWDVGSGVKFTPDNNNTYTLFFKVEKAGVTLNNKVFKPMINIGDKAKPWQPYISDIVEIPEALLNLDGYGWGVNDSIYNYVDWEKKQFVKRVGCLDLGTLSWLDYGNHSFAAYNFTSNVVLTNGDKPSSILAAGYENVNYANRASGNKTVCGAKANGSNVIFIYDTNYTNAADLKASITGVKLLYELAEPIITDISDLITDDNLIGVEGGGTVTAENEHKYEVPFEVIYRTEVEV